MSEINFMAGRILLHVGYHKTATTWMQQQLFIPEHGYRQVAHHAEVWEHVVGVHGLLFDPADMKSAVSSGMSELGSDEVPVVSSEIISGHPFFGGMGSDVFAERMKRALPDAKVLISVRHQLRMLTSMYMQYVSRGGTMSPERFFAGDPDLGFYGFRPEHLEYHRLVGLYQDLFGAENVLVISQEGISKDMDAVADLIAKFAGNRTFTSVSPDKRAAYAPSYPEYAIPILRRINSFQKSVLNPSPFIRLGTGTQGLYKLVGAGMRRPPFSLLKGRYSPVSDSARSMFLGRFDDSNRALARLIDTELFWPEPKTIATTQPSAAE